MWLLVTPGSVCASQLGTTYICVFQHTYVRMYVDTYNRTVIFIVLAMMYFYYTNVVGKIVHVQRWIEFMALHSCHSCHGSRVYWGMRCDFPHGEAFILLQYSSVLKLCGYVCHAQLSKHSFLSGLTTYFCTLVQLGLVQSPLDGHTCMPVSVYVCMCSTCVCTCMCVCGTCVCTCMCVCVWYCVHLYVCACV